MNCRHARKAISAYVDDALSLDEKRDFEAHLRTCTACRKRLEETQALHRLFASAERFAAPHGFAPKILATIAEKERSRQGSFFSIRPVFLRAVQVAVALIVLTIGIISGNLILPERPNTFGQAAVRQTFSLNLFQAMPPDSIGGIYNSLMGARHEK